MTSPVVRRYALLAAGLILALLLPRLIYPVLALDILLWALFAVALDLLLGYTGLLSFGHSAFWGLGGYTAAYMAKTWGWAFPVATLVATLMTLAASAPMGYLAIRRKGIYFAMVTLAFAQMGYYVANEWRDVTGGENGLQGVPRMLPGVPLNDPVAFYYAVLPIVLGAFWFAYRVVHSPFGHVLVAVRDNEARAQALGYPTRRYKLLAFVLSAGLSGLAGSLFALGHGFAALDLVDWRTSGQVVIMTVLGGIGTLWGSVVGAVIVLLLRDWLATWTDAWGAVTGFIFAIVVLGFRRGVWGTLAHAVHRRSSSARALSPPTEVPPQPAPRPESVR